MELSEQVFVADSENAQLPAYTEWGYNTFGAYYDREVFKSNSSDVPLKIVVRNDTTTFIFKGTKLSSKSSSYYANGEDMVMYISFPNMSFLGYAELTTLHGTVLDFKSRGAVFSLMIDQVVLQPVLLNGMLEIKNARRLMVDGEAYEIILSGLFDIQFLIQQEPISLYNGRFDFGVHNGNFYRF